MRAEGGPASETQKHQKQDTGKRANLKGILCGLSDRSHRFLSCVLEAVCHLQLISQS